MILPQHLSELKPLRQWVNYVRIWNADKHGGQGGYDKPPINPHTLRDGRTNDPATWAIYDEAAANIGKPATHKDSKHKDSTGNAPIITAPIEGTGLVLANGYCGVDLDDVIDETGNVAPWAAAIIERLDTYTEISPSGHGLHSLLCCGNLLAAGVDFGKQFLIDADGNVTTDPTKKAAELEIYFYTRGGRYFTITGNVYRDRPIARDKDETLKAIYAEHMAKLAACKAALRPARSVGSLRITRPASSDAERKMLDSALAVIDPSELVFEEWSSIMTAMKISGYSLLERERWSSGGLCGRPNPKNVTATNYQRNFHFKHGDESAAGTIINAAKDRGWNPADAFDDEERREYGRTLYTEDERREYGRQQHEARLDKFWSEHEDGFREWKDRHKAKQDPQPKNDFTDDFRAWKKGRADK